MPSQIDGAFSATGQWTFVAAPTFPANTFGNNQANPNDPFAGDKTKHRLRATLSQVQGSAAASERRYVHRARAAGTIKEFKALVGVAAAGAATVTVDLQKSTAAGAPATVLSGVVTIDNTTAINTALSGTVTSADYIAGDILEVRVVATAGGGTLPQELFVTLEVEESPA